jgi:hypothetical protein
MEKSVKEDTMQLQNANIIGGAFDGLVITGPAVLMPDVIELSKHPIITKEMEEEEKAGMPLYPPSTGNEVYMLAIDFVEGKDYELIPKKMCYIIASDDLEWKPIKPR